ncbi:MAG TPA: 3-hydroxyacyl-CoA dehydrogenase/enoyl-CoA hydratase family protein [Terriglobales bacterium]|nr:3-hydroxyacyl-CoA dehydrogenase/enoyl-CoA hydratase family protein [Terriglobales bacterium]
MKRIDKVAVLGAGTMGARIAAHMANAGVPVLLLDRSTQIAAAGLDAARKSKPAAFFTLEFSKLISVGNFDDDLTRLAQVDWIIEAIVEDLEIKRTLLRKVEAIRKPGTIITTNTSGLPVAKIAEGFSEDFRRAWFGTHFFNPPRYMRLLEVIATPDSDPALVESVAKFSDLRLGKGVVFANDTPNFIANRIGTFSVLNIMRLMQEFDLSIEEVDALTGTVLGWPRSATFRTLDLVGLDILAHVTANMPSEQNAGLKVPDFFKKMLERKWLGDKTGGGFYKKTKDGERLALNWKTLEYSPSQKPKFPSLDMAKAVEDIGARLQTILFAPKPDKAGQFLWAALSDLWSYSADRIGEISDSVADIDRAMCLGFNWELGPFAMWDAAGVKLTVERMRGEGKTISPNAEKLLSSGKISWDAKNTAWSVAAARKSHGVVRKNSSASIVDLGDGVACIEFHSKMNTLGSDIVSLVTQTLRPGGAGDGFDAFVITNDAANFSAGANLMLLLMSAQDEDWDDIDLAIRQFQGMTQAIKFSPKPAVIAPFGMALGGGCEMSLHAAALQPHSELYMGLVEIGVGLLPGGGGCKEMLLRSNGSQEAMRKIFETIAMAKVSTSAEEARGLGFLRESDNVSMNRERVLGDAKSKALELVSRGYAPPQPRTDIPAPGENILAALKLGVHLMHQGGYITDYEKHLAQTIAKVLCGGNVAPGKILSEQNVLDLEREAFKSLCGEKKTQERIQYTLKTGKALRN